MKRSLFRRDLRFQQGRAAFSLVELLVVIAIVALLLSMMMPGLSLAREMARDARCKANMRQMSIAGTIYRTDFGYYLPRYISQTDSPLFNSGGGGYVPGVFGQPGLSLLRSGGYVQVKIGAAYSSGITYAGQRRNSISLCPSGQYFGPASSPGTMGYVLTPRTLTGLDPESRIQDGYEATVGGMDVQSYQLNNRFETTKTFVGVTNPVYVPVKRVDDSIPPSQMLMWAEYYYRDGVTHAYSPSMVDLKGVGPYASEPAPKYTYYRTPHGSLNSGNFSAVDGHVGNLTLNQLQAAYVAATYALSAKELPFTY